jgi:hypothetical protein
MDLLIFLQLRDSKITMLICDEASSKSSNKDHFDSSGFAAVTGTTAEVLMSAHPSKNLDKGCLLLFLRSHMPRFSSFLFQLPVPNQPPTPILATDPLCQRGPALSSLAPSARSVAFCAWVKPLIPVILRRS